MRSAFIVLETNVEFSKRLEEDRKFISKDTKSEARRTRSRKFIL